MTPGGTSGVPTAPRYRASRPRHSSSTSSGSTTPSRRYRAPPRSYSTVSSSTPDARTTFRPSATTSGPMPSPPITPMRWATAAPSFPGPFGGRRYRAPVSRRLLVPLLATALTLTVACSGDDDGADPAATVPPSGSSAIELTPLAVALDEPGRAPREVLEQRSTAGTTWDGGIELNLGVADVLGARAIGDSTLSVDDVDAEGNATVHYTLDGLDVALGSGGARPGQAK